jgi:CRP-like cAMP-binding protein
MTLSRIDRASNRTLDLLRRVPAFAGSTDRQLAAAARLVDESAVPAGAVLTKEGTIGREAFIVVEGEAEVTIQGDVVTRIGPGEFLGEMALVDHGPRSATVVAQTPMVLLVVSPGAFDAFVAQQPVARALAKELAERLRRSDAQLGARAKP